MLSRVMTSTRLLRLRQRGNFPRQMTWVDVSVTFQTSQILVSGSVRQVAEHELL